ncbi:MAG: type II toxin-antitoxin system VapC family toxin [Dehalococcoidia bacterium]
MTRYLLDTNIISDLMRHPSGPAAEQIRRVGEDAIYTSVIVAGELRFGAAKLGSPRMTERVEAILERIEVLPLTLPVDERYGELRARLEPNRNVLGSHDLWIAAHALAADCCIVTDNGREFARVNDHPREGNNVLDSVNHSF